MKRALFDTVTVLPFASGNVVDLSLIHISEPTRRS
mgnify:CR=1 FL=1